MFGKLPVFPRVFYLCDEHRLRERSDDRPMNGSPESFGGTMHAGNRVLLNVERDSVCAGDDVDAPHCKRFAFDANVSVVDALSVIIKAGYLARIAGGKATWIVEADKPMAVVAEQWSSPAFLIDPATRLVDCVHPNASKPLFFRYWCQVDPAVVFDCLKANKPLPDMYGRDE
jgi:hypothetical protein